MARILIIEDEALLREEVAEWLAFEGHDITQASNGRTGIDCAREQPFDLVISDISMPEMDGYRVLLELRTQPATVLTPFIFLTARAERKDLRVGMELGADDYITKPFSREELLASVQARLQKQEAIATAAKGELNELRRTIIFNLPHELRTPLVGILGYGEMLATREFTFEPEELWSMGRSILKSGRRLQYLIENYLLYAQIEVLMASGMETIQPSPIEAPHLLVRDTARRAAESRDRMVDLTLSLEPALVLMRVKDLEKVIIELVDNAFKFSEPGQPVRISAGPQDERYHIVIQDQGRGMTPEQIDGIGAYMQFERQFYEQQGSGLGLIISKRLVELNGGMFALQGTSPGLRVSLSLPLAPRLRDELL